MNWRNYISLCNIFHVNFLLWLYSECRMWMMSRCWFKCYLKTTVCRLLSVYQDILKLTNIIQLIKCRLCWKHTVNGFRWLFQTWFIYWSTETTNAMTCTVRSHSITRQWSCPLTLIIYNLIKLYLQLCSWLSAQFN